MIDGRECFGCSCTSTTLTEGIPNISASNRCYKLKAFEKKLQTFFIRIYSSVSACDVIRFNELITKLRIHVSSEPLRMCAFVQVDFRVKASLDG